MPRESFDSSSFFSPKDSEFSTIEVFSSSETEAFKAASILSFETETPVTSKVSSFFSSVGLISGSTGSTTTLSLDGLSSAKIPFGFTANKSVRGN